jgi:hypothetical protein
VVRTAHEALTPAMPAAIPGLRPDPSFLWLPCICTLFFSSPSPFLPSLSSLSDHRAQTDTWSRRHVKHSGHLPKHSGWITVCQSPQLLTCPVLWAANGFWRVSEGHAPPTSPRPYTAFEGVQKNGLRDLSRFLHQAGEDSVRVTVKFIRRRIHFQHTESGLLLESEQRGQVLRLKYLLRNS